MGAKIPPSARIRKAGAHDRYDGWESTFPLYHSRMIPKTAGETMVMPKPAADWRPRLTPQILGLHYHLLSQPPPVYTRNASPRCPSNPGSRSRPARASANEMTREDNAGVILPPTYSLDRSVLPLDIRAAMRNGPMPAPEGRNEDHSGRCVEAAARSQAVRWNGLLGGVSISLLQNYQGDSTENGCAGHRQAQGYGLTEEDEATQGRNDRNAKLHCCRAGSFQGG